MSYLEEESGVGFGWGGVAGVEYSLRGIQGGPRVGSDSNPQLSNFSIDPFLEGDFLIGSLPGTDSWGFPASQFLSATGIT